MSNISKNVNQFRIASALAKVQGTLGQSLIGKGWGFPMRMTVQGGFQLSEHDHNLEESILIILSTRLGERVYRPDFGSQLHELVFAPLNDETLLLAQVYARDAIQKWEPRISVESVTAESGADGVSLNINLYYRIKETHQRRSLVYPFYLTPPSE